MGHEWIYGYIGNCQAGIEEWWVQMLSLGKESSGNATSVPKCPPFLRFEQWALELRVGSWLQCVLGFGSGHGSPKGMQPGLRGDPKSGLGCNCGLDSWEVGHSLHSRKILLSLVFHHLSGGTTLSGGTFVVRPQVKIKCLHTSLECLHTFLSDKWHIVLLGPISLDRHKSPEWVTRTSDTSLPSKKSLFFLYTLAMRLTFPSDKY